MASFVFELGKLLADEAIDNITQEKKKNAPNLKTSNHINNRPNPNNFTLFNFSEIAMKIPGLNAVADVMAKQEGLITGGLGSIWDDIKDFPGISEVVPDGLESMLDRFAEGKSFMEGGATKPDEPSGSPGKGSTTGDLAWGGHRNGEIPSSAMKTVKDAAGNGYMFEKSAGEDFERLVRASILEGFGVTLTGAYRTYQRQVELKAEKPTLAATPGNSNHGWGRAVDVNLNRVWMQRNGHRFNWIWPDWARPGGSRPEDWHFEHRP